MNRMRKTWNFKELLHLWAAIVKEAVFPLNMITVRFLEACIIVPEGRLLIASRGSQQPFSMSEKRTL